MFKDGKYKIETKILTSDDGQKIFTYQVIYEKLGRAKLKIQDIAVWRFDFEEPKNPILLRLPDVVPTAESTQDNK